MTHCTPLRHKSGTSLCWHHWISSSPKRGALNASNSRPFDSVCFSSTKEHVTGRARSLSSKSRRAVGRAFRGVFKVRPAFTWIRPKHFSFFLCEKWKTLWNLKGKTLFFSQKKIRFYNPCIKQQAVRSLYTFTLPPTLYPPPAFPPVASDACFDPYSVCVCACVVVPTFSRNFPACQCMRAKAQKWKRFLGGNSLRKRDSELFQLLVEHVQFSDFHPPPP